MSLINIAPIGKVLFSSKSGWSTENDSKEILLAENGRDFSFHTAQEDCPWFIIDLLDVYTIKKIRIKNRLKVCQEKAKTLRIEKLLSNSFSSSEILFDSRENFGDCIEVPIDTKCQLLKFSLKEFSYFHLKQVEIFSDSEDLEQFQKHNNHDDTLNSCLTTLSAVFDCYIKTHYFNEIYFYNSNKDKFATWHKYVKYRLSNLEANAVLFCDIDMIEGNDDLIPFLQVIGEKNQLSITINYDKKIITLSTKILISLKDQINILFNNLLDILNKGIKALTEDKTLVFEGVKNSAVIIDTDKIYDYGGGFADRLRGVLSLIENCKNLNINYFIKFTKPFNLNKYYSYKEYSENERSNVSNHSHCAMTILSGLSSKGIEDVLTVAKNKYEFITIYTHVFNYFNKSTFTDNFKKTEYFSNEYQKYKKVIGDDYVSVSFRFVNSLGDFDDTSSWNQTLDEEQQQYLMDRCKNELREFIAIKNFNAVLVLSDSTKFLNYVKDIPHVYVFPDFIAHVGKHKSNTNDERCFLKTLIDFNLIADAKESYRFQTEHLYHSAFPRVASMCAGRRVIEHNFDL